MRRPRDVAVVPSAGTVVPLATLHMQISGQSDRPANYGFVGRRLPLLYAASLAAVPDVHSASRMNRRLAADCGRAVRGSDGVNLDAAPPADLVRLHKSRPKGVDCGGVWLKRPSRRGRPPRAGGLTGADG